MNFRGLITRSALALLAMLSVAPCQGERVPIAAEQIATALQAFGVPLQGAAVQLQVRMSSATAAPALTIGAVEPWGERRARVRVSCVDRTECLPFYASLEWEDAATARAALQAVHASGGGSPAGRVSADNGERTAAVPAPAALATPAARAVHAPLASGSLADHAGAVVDTSGGVRTGAHVTLRLQGLRIQIDVPVVCLQAGAPGQTIRVTAADGKQNYTAEVVDPTLLKGSL